MDIERREKLRRVILYTIEALIVVGLLFCAYVFNWLDGRLTYVVDGEPYRVDVALRTSHFKLPEDPKVPGYDFLGWYTDDETFEDKFELSDLPELFLFSKTVVYAKLVEHNHEYKSTVLTEPTCLKDGLKADVCNLNGCGSQINTTTIKKLDHSYKYGVIKEATCLSDGIKGNYCVYGCGKQYNTSPVEKLDHSISNGTLTMNITNGNKTFAFSGTCSECNKKFNQKNVTVTLNDDISNVETCLVEGNYVYTYVFENTTYTYTHKVPVLPHVLNGVYIDTLETSANGHVPYGTENVAIVEDAQVICGSVADAYFVCEFCERYCDVIVEREHNRAQVVDIAATCTEDGRYELICANEDCNASFGYETIDALDHDYKYTLTVKTANGFSVLVECNRDACDYTDLASVKNSDVTSKTKKATCIEEGLITYTGKINGKTGSFTEVLPLTYHTSGNKYVTSNVVDVEFPGLYYFVNTSEPDCGETSSGYYFCEVCDRDNKEPIMVTVTKNHKYDSKIITPATCTSAGVKAKTCVYCDVSVTESYGPLDHNYKWTLVVDTTDEIYDVNDIVKAAASCTTCGTATLTVDIDPAGADKDYVRLEKKAPKNCGETASYIYTFKKNVPNVGNLNLTYTHKTNDYGDHYLNNRPLSELLESDGVPEGSSDKSVKFSVGNVYLFGNHDVELVCYNLTHKLESGWFICDNCDNVVYTLVYIDHYVEDSDYKVTTPETCGDDGVESAKCDCGFVLERPVSATGKHTFDYTMTPVYGNDDVINSFVIARDCKNCNKEDNASWKTVKTSDVTVQVLDHGSCCELGTTKYTYSKNGVTVSCNVNSYGSHYVCGVRIQELQYQVENDDGELVWVIPSDTEGISLPEDYNPVDDGDIVNGGFICDKCEEFIISSVIVVVDDE